MKAIVFAEYGSPDLLQLKEVPKPTPKDDEVLIKVHASSINSWDWEFQSGTSFINRLLYGLLKPKTTNLYRGRSWYIDIYIYVQHRERSIRLVKYLQWPEVPYELF